MLPSIGLHDVPSDAKRSRVCKGKQYFMSQVIIDKVLKCPRLPSLPTIAVEVIELCRTSDINIKQIATTISNDPALSSKILKTVNSSYYGLSQSVSTISHALVILGLNSVKTLALGFSLVSNFKGDKDSEFDMMEFWKRSLFGAVGARTIAQKAGLIEHEEAFLGGLFSDLGVMAMVQTIGKSDGYIGLIGEAGDDNNLLIKLERQRFGTTHTEVGAQLAEKWKLPPILVAPIQYHEFPDKAPPAVEKIVRAVSLGHKSAGLFLNRPNADIDAFFAELRQSFELNHADCEELLKTIGDATKEMARLFDIDCDSVSDAGALLAEANETLLQLTLESQQSADQLQQTNEQLQEQMNRDALTGAANRGRFNGYIEQQFEFAKKQTSALGVIFLDADRFKSVNDTHGHAAGDAVLISLSKTLQDTVGGEGLVARYGGEEFAIVLPGYDRKRAAQLAEQIRKNVESTPIAYDECLTLHVTISLGVASFDGVTVFQRPDQLVQAADKAVYAAKHSGRNCVRVFAPRTPQVAAG